jgi:hypothetical protein
MNEVDRQESKTKGIWGAEGHQSLRIDAYGSENAIAILNDFLCISVLMNFGKIKFMFLSEKLKQKFDNLKRPT